MFDISGVDFTFAFGFVATTLLLVWYGRRSACSNGPPGPAVLIPGLGHLLKFLDHPVHQLRKLRHQYGDIFQIYMGTFPVVVVSGHDLISEVLQTRGTEFSNRPHSFLAEKLAKNKGLLNTNGEVWLEQRKFLVRVLKPLVASGGPLEVAIKKAASRLTTKLRTLVEADQANCVDVSSLMKQSVFFTSFSLAYGRHADFDSDNFIAHVNKYDQFFRCLNLAVLTAFMPWLQWLPGDPVKYKKCDELAVSIIKEFVEPEIERLKKALTNNNYYEADSESQPTLCLAGAYIKEMVEKHLKGIPTVLSDEQLPVTVSDVIAGSFDTNSATLCWFLLYMIHYPDVQKKCREEILDSAMVSLTDLVINKFVYTQATIMEVLRHANIAPMPPSHCSKEDTHLGGFFIPKNTAIIINTDSLLMGPEVGDDATVFRPERFINDDGKLINPRWFISFSAGKRMCPGMAVARKEILMFIVDLLSNFHFRPPKLNGIENFPPLEGDFGNTHSPKPFGLSVSLAQPH